MCRLWLRCARIRVVRGRRYRLDVIEGDGSRSIVVRNNTRLEVPGRPGTSRFGRDLVLQKWYRQQLRNHLPQLIAKWEPTIGVKIAECRIKKMKTRWGSCNVAARRVWLNLELAKERPSCLVHEMVHFLERHHNDRFKGMRQARSRARSPKFLLLSE